MVLLDYSLDKENKVMPPKHLLMIKNMAPQYIKPVSLATYCALSFVQIYIKCIFARIDRFKKKWLYFGMDLSKITQSTSSFNWHQVVSAEYII